jgi:superfamily II DNA or RNA helicase
MAGAKSVLCVMPTGAGKSVVIGSIAHDARLKGKRTVATSHRKELVHQNAAKIRAHGTTCGIIMAGNAPDESADVHSASIQTLSRREIPWEPDILMPDEAHLSLSNSYRELFKRWPNAVRIGWTATPCAPNGKGLCAVYDALVIGPSVKELQAEGALAQIRCYSTPAVADLSGLSVRGGDFAAEQLAERMKKDGIVGDAVQHYRKLGGGKSAVCFCVNVDRSKATCEEFNRAGIPSMHIDGEMSEKERASVLVAVADGTCQVLCSVDVVSVGFDCPRLKVAIMLRPTMSIVVYLQSVGRVMRPYEGQEAVLLDCVGNAGRHGLPTMDREWTLADRKEASKSEEKALVGLYTCLTCYGQTSRPADVCSCCGAEIPVKDRVIPATSGELKLIEEQVEFKRKEQLERELRACTGMAELIAFAKRQGYEKPHFWAKIKFNTSWRKAWAQKQQSKQKSAAL